MAEYNIPGVYSKIDASAAVQSLSPNNSVIGIVGLAEEGEFNKPYAPTSLNDAISVYGKDSNIVKLMMVASENGAGAFIAVRVDNSLEDAEPDYESAFNALAKEEAVDIVIIDSVEKTDISLLKNHLQTTSENRKERIGFYGYEKSTTVKDAIADAQEYNSGRLYGSYPNLLDIDGNEVSGVFSAAALAGQVAAETDPSMPMTNVQLNGFYGVANKLEDSEMDALIVGGVIPLEALGGNIFIVRAVSTYTKSPDGETDITWQEITTTRISDYIFKDLRSRLRRNYARAKQTQETRDSIKSEVISSLLAYQELDYIQNVDPSMDVSISISPINPLRNDVNFKYNVTGPLNVIHLTGQLVI